MNIFYEVFEIFKDFWRSFQRGIVYFYFCFIVVNYTVK